MNITTDSIDAALARGRARRTLPAAPDRRLIRQRAGLSQRDVAKAVGVSRVLVTLWEKGTRTPGPSHIDAYLKILQRCASEGLQLTEPALVARHHEPPAGWPPELFAAVTDALAAALVAAVRRDEAQEQKAAER